MSYGKYVFVEEYSFELPDELDQYEFVDEIASRIVDDDAVPLDNEAIDGIDGDAPYALTNEDSVLFMFTVLDNGGSIQLDLDNEGERLSVTLTTSYNLPHPTQSDTFQDEAREVFLTHNAVKSVIQDYLYEHPDIQDVALDV